MEFANDRHRDAYERVSEITARFADFGTMTEAPGFVLAADIARVFILVLPWTEDHTVLQVRAYLDRDLDFDGELATHLLELNAQVVLGAWGWESGKAFYQYTALADDIDESTFDAAMGSVIASVSAQGESIAQRWGTNEDTACASEASAQEDASTTDNDGDGADA